jgi:hypothetical protein
MQTERSPSPEVVALLRARHYLRAKCGASVHRSESESRARLENVLIPILRFIAAAYETGDSCCWEAAYRTAEGTETALGAAFLVAHAAALVRAIRRNEGSKFYYLPVTSKFLSSDEEKLIILVEMEAECENSFLGPAAIDIAGVGNDAPFTEAIKYLGEFWRQRTSALGQIVFCVYSFPSTFVSKISKCLSYQIP